MPPTLLVIDDNPSVRESLRFLLLHRGYQVLVAENGPEGIALAAQNIIAGALVDVSMPGMNGIDVCRALRAHAAQAGRDLPVWMMTGARTESLARQALEAGALVLLQKPFSYADLFRQFDEHLGGPPETPKAVSDVLDNL